MNKCTNTKKTLRSRSTEGYYIPDDVEKINEESNDIDIDNTYADEGEESFDNDFFHSLNKTINNHQAIKTSTNYEIMANFLKQLKKTQNGEKIGLRERLDIVCESLHSLNQKQNDTMLNHFISLTEKLFNCSETKRHSLLAKLVEFPLECVSSYVQGTINSDLFLRRKYYDGQTRTRKDGSTYQRRYNIATESDLICIGDDGKEYSPIQMIEFYDEYFKGDLLAQLNDDEKEVALWLNRLSTYKRRATIKELVEHTGFTKRQIETIEKKLKFKALIWLQDNGLYDDYNNYYNLCKKYKNFDKNYEKFIKSVKK